MKRLAWRRWSVSQGQALGALAVLVLTGALVLSRGLDVSGARNDALRGAVGEDEEGLDAAEPSQVVQTASLELEDQPQALPLAWAPDPEDMAWERLTQDLALHASRHRGRAAIFLKDLKNGRTWAYHADDLFPSASLIKMPIMACVFYRIHEGRLSLGDRLVLRRHHRVGGSGSIKWSRDGARFTVKELLYRSIGESDNTATAMLVDALGLDYIRRRFVDMGLFYTEIFPEGMSIKGGRVARENYTTAREMAGLLERIYRGELVDRSSSELMLDILRHRRPARSRLAKGLPRGWEIAHKTGLVRMACHDSAIFLTPKGDYSLTVLTGQNGSYGAAKDFISRLGGITFRHYLGRGGHALARAAMRRDGAVLR